MMFSEHLLELRTKAGLTQQETAKGSKMSLRAYQNYEWGLRRAGLPDVAEEAGGVSGPALPVKRPRASARGRLAND